MPYCPRCQEEFEGDLSFCPKCNYEFGQDEDGPDGWVLVGKIFDKTSADYAQETLKTYNIPVAVISESGFFGNVGLPLPSLSGKGIGKYKIYVPSEFLEEAENVLEMILGDSVDTEDEEE